MKKSFIVLTGITISVLSICSLNLNAQMMVKNIAAGALNSSPSYLTDVNGVLFFQAWDAANGFELWKSDGTDAGTVLVKDIRPGAGNSNPSELININGTLYFVANDGIHGNELWKSNGTDAGTVMVKDIWAGADGSLWNSLYVGFINVNDTLYFTGDDGTNGMTLWKSDGTEAGTVMVKNLLNPSDKVNVNGTLYVYAAGGLWKSDGTSNGTVLVKTINIGGGLTAWLTNVNGTLFFSAGDDTSTAEVWKSDGTTAGTVMVKDINPGSSNSSNPSNLTNIGGVLFFNADNGSNGTELWKSDGTDAGTVMVKDLYPGSFGSFNGPVVDLTDVNGLAFFAATDGVNGYEVWKSDGTDAGTLMVKDIAPGSNSSMSGFFPYFTNVNGMVYFNAFGCCGNELYRSDGSDTGTVMLNDINPGSGSSTPDYLTNVNGTLFFSAADGTNGTELWALNTLTSISEVNETNKISIYPNPFSSQTILQTDNFFKDATLTVYNSFGQQVKQLTNISGQTVTLFRDHLANGLYFVRLTEENKTIGVDKLIIADN